MFKHITIVFDSNEFKINNVYQIALCTKFYAKQTKFEPLYARKCVKR